MLFGSFRHKGKGHERKTGQESWAKEMSLRFSAPCQILRSTLNKCRMRRSNTQGRRTRLCASDPSHSTASREQDQMQRSTPCTTHERKTRLCASDPSHSTLSRWKTERAIAAIQDSRERDEPLCFRSLADEIEYLLEGLKLRHTCMLHRLRTDCCAKNCVRSNELFKNFADHACPISAQRRSIRVQSATYMILHSKILQASMKTPRPSHPCTPSHAWFVGNQFCKKYTVRDILHL